MLKKLTSDKRFIENEHDILVIGLGTKGVFQYNYSQTLKKLHVSIPSNCLIKLYFQSHDARHSLARKLRKLLSITFIN